MTKQVRRKLNFFSAKLLLAAAGIMAMALPLILLFVDAPQSHAQTTPATATPGIVGTWQGTLHAGKDLRTVIKITKAADGTLKSTFYSIDQGGGSFPVTSTTLEGSTVKLSLQLIDGTYEGKLSADGNSISGNWKQGPNSLPLNLARATPATEWTIPAPAARIPPMAADVNPSFEVATIKPSKAGGNGKGFRVNGRNFSTIHTSLDDLIEFAYGVHQEQILGGPDWLNQDRYDIAAVPDQPGAPSYEQWKTMLQKLLTNRFQLKFHHSQKVLSVYVLTVAKNGPKNLTKSASTAPGFSIPIGQAPGGVRMAVMNGTMKNFAIFGLQGAVMDRPVQDHTGLTDRYNFSLKWAPDLSQFGGHFPPPAAGSTDVLPDLYTAIQEQLGLKLTAMKAPADVLVIDHVEKPSPN